MFSMSSIFFAFSLTLLAGLSTVAGVLIINKNNITDEFLCKILGFSAGVMLFVSLIEIFQKGLFNLTIYMGDRSGYLATLIIFFLGILFIMLIDKFIPNSIEVEKEKDLLKLGIVSAVALSIHNFPEGLVTFISALYDKNLGFSIALAIAIHNIPEGIIVAIPIYMATKRKKVAFLITLISGLSEPLGALIGFIVFKNIFNEFIFGAIFSFVSGIMVYIVINELLPTAFTYGSKDKVSKSFILGIFIMGISLYLFK